MELILSQGTWPGVDVVAGQDLARSDRGGWTGHGQDGRELAL